ncbi:DUF3592 domain-containing protein [Natrinema caseinilyticum]|uniref:DUF3592 domain-containing protein n=1 Tax=Natrinema caseinilyticum TaxID=2961570 RepID=UPI0020C2AC32|nr:DUF3592 domain-containing protein [Natrinema caseinilyticum]
MELDFNGPSGAIQIAIALIIGLGTIGYGAYSYSAQSSALDTAETVDATIVSTSIETREERRGTDYTPHVTFNYVYEGETYTASNVYPGKLPREFGSKEDARAELDGYEPGDTVTAYVPPNSPGNAFLKHESSNKPLLVVGFGGIVVMGTIFTVLRD